MEELNFDKLENRTKNKKKTKDKNNVNNELPLLSQASSDEKDEDPLNLISNEYQYTQEYIT